MRWAEYPYERYYVGQRRWTQREILEPVVEYHLRMRETTGIFIAWVRDYNLMAWEEAEGESQPRTGL